MRIQVLKIFLGVICMLGICPLTMAAESAPKDAVSTRVLSFFREHGHYVDAPEHDADSSYWIELKWYRAQGEGVRPALMYLMTVEYGGQFAKMADTLNALLNAPGDQAEVLRFVRTELRSLYEEGNEEASSFVNVSLRALAKYGDGGDLSLIEQFKDFPDPTVRSSAFRQYQNLKKSVEDQQKRPKPFLDSDGAEGSATGRDRPDSASPDGTSSSPPSQADGPSWIAWGLLVAGFALIVGIVGYLRSKRP